MILSIKSQFKEERKMRMDNPCQKAKDFYKEILDKIDILYDRARGILGKEDEGK